MIHVNLEIIQEKKKETDEHSKRINLSLVVKVLEEARASAGHSSVD